MTVDPHSIGYLESLGLDYSVFRPTGGMTWVLEHLYVYTDLPWWAVIALSAAAVRVLFFKVFVNAAKNSAKMHAIQPVVKPLTDKMTAAARAKDTNTVMHIRAQIKGINKEAGVKISRSFMPALQIFPASGTFFTLRMMSNVPVPALETGGVLWFENLTLADPFFILPLATSFMLYRSLKVSFLFKNQFSRTENVKRLTKTQLPERWRSSNSSNPNPRNATSIPIRSPRYLPNLYLLHARRYPTLLLRLRCRLLHPIDPQHETLVQKLLQHGSTSS